LAPKKHRARPRMRAAIQVASSGRAKAPRPYANFADRSEALTPPLDCTPRTPYRWLDAEAERETNNDGEK
jgi:hypothetical protein